MRYIEGVDYWIRFVDFPNMASESVVASHGDGTFTIYINTLFSEERQIERLNHELRHLEAEHFYRDELTITQLEHQADGLTRQTDPDPAGAAETRIQSSANDGATKFQPPANAGAAKLQPPANTATAKSQSPDGAAKSQSPDPAGQDIFSAVKRGVIPAFSSLEALKKYVFALSGQPLKQEE